MPEFRSIRLRLTLWYIALLAVILAAFAAGIYVTLRQSLYSSLDDSLETRAEDLMTVVQFEGDRPVIAGLSPIGANDEGEHYIRTYDTAGDISYEAGVRAAAAGVDNGAVRAALSGKTRTFSRDVDGDTFRTELTPIESAGDVVGVMEIARSESDISETLGNLVLILALGYPATLALTSFGGIFLAGRALAPIDKLTRVARRISAEDLSQRLDMSLPDDEVGRLARTFDEMLARLERSFRQQQQFTADASHELRTPLTAIKGQVEVALTKGRSPEAYQEVLRSVNEEVDRLIRLVGSLLRLARADAGQIALQREPVDVAALISGAVEQVQPIATERQVTLDIEAGPPLTMHADQDLLLQLLLNLLDNAVRHTPAGGRVHVDWQTNGSSLELRVRDTGPGIAQEDRERVFDRFYRVDKARARAGGGAGLGLNICKWIAEAHRGSVRADSAPGQGATFIVTLPR